MCAVLSMFVKVYAVDNDEKAIGSVYSAFESEREKVARGYHCVGRIHGMVSDGFLHVVSFPSVRGRAWS